MITRTTVVAIVAAAITMPALAQNAVQWTKAEGGNGHWYELVENDPALCWLEAQAHAETLGGELASLETIAEFEFAKTIVYGGSGPYGASIGLLQDEGSAEPADGFV